MVSDGGGRPEIATSVDQIRVETDSVERSFELISAMYTPVRHEQAEHPDHFWFAVDGHGLEDFRVERLTHTSGYRMTTDPTGFVGVITLLKGVAAYSAGGREVRIGRWDSLLFPGDVDLQVQHSGYELRMVSIPLDRIQARADELSGTDGVPARFRLGTPHSRSAERQWTATVEYFDRELRRGDPALDHPLSRQTALNLLMDVTLATFTDVAARAADREASTWASERLYRRAQALIEEEAGHLITEGDIAATLNIDVATVRSAFRRYGSSTPTTALRRCRLQRAGEKLQRRRLTDPVAIAPVLARWGFGDPVRFVRLYREAFGIRPDQTWSR